MFISKLIPVKEATKIINGVKPKTTIEEILLEDAYNRVLAEDIISLLNSPSFDNSDADGYAIKADDTFGSSYMNPTRLAVVGGIYAGQLSERILESGEAIKIATGAPMPDGANAVVMQEYAYEENGMLEIETPLRPGENVLPKNEDFKKDDLLLNSGQLLKPQDVGIITSAGYEKIDVFKKPKIGIITTGNELVRPKSNIKEAEVINSNYYILKTLVESCLAVPELTHCRDDPEKLKKQLEMFLKSCDVIITTGGTALGRGDIVVDVMGDMGEVLIHGVALRPGKSFGFGTISGTPIFMLSGHPVAAMVQFDVFVREKILEMQNIQRKFKTIKKIASKKIASTLGRTDYIRSKTDGNNVKPLKIKGSRIIRSMVESDCYIIVEENLEGIAEGKECEILLYDSLEV